MIVVVASPCFFKEDVSWVGGPPMYTLSMCPSMRSEWSEGVFTPVLGAFRLYSDHSKCMFIPGLNSQYIFPVSEGIKVWTSGRTTGWRMLSGEDRGHSQEQEESWCLSWQNQVRPAYLQVNSSVLFHLSWLTETVCNTWIYIAGMCRRLRHYINKVLTFMVSVLGRDRLILLLPVGQYFPWGYTSFWLLTTTNYLAFKSLIMLFVCHFCIVPHSPDDDYDRYPPVLGFRLLRHSFSDDCIWHHYGFRAATPGLWIRMTP